LLNHVVGLPNLFDRSMYAAVTNVARPAAATAVA
jgi:hypothetical protein